mgnify:CR=1 FL=1
MCEFPQIIVSKMIFKNFTCVPVKKWLVLLLYLNVNSEAVVKIARETHGILKSLRSTGFRKVRELVGVIEYAFAALLLVNNNASICCLI